MQISFPLKDSALFEFIEKGAWKNNQGQINGYIVLNEISLYQLGDRVVVRRKGVTSIPFCSRAGIFKPLWSLGIDAKASTPPAYVAWRAGTITLFLVGA